MVPHFVVLTGASGSCKTTIARCIQQHHLPTLEVVFFDSAGVPPADQMVSEYGSVEAWQRATTAWMVKIRELLAAGRAVLFEGQMRIAFILDALAEAGIARAQVILADCSDNVRNARLRTDRNQAELANPIMMSWATCLREEAWNAGFETLDTERFPLAECVDYICQRLGIRDQRPI
jgi:adenylate kinase family enzyme